MNKKGRNGGGPFSWQTKHFSPTTGNNGKQATSTSPHEQRIFCLRPKGEEESEVCGTYVTVFGLAASVLHCRKLEILLRTADASLKGRKGFVAMSLRKACMSSGGMESTTHCGSERLGRSWDQDRSSTLPFAMRQGATPEDECAGSNASSGCSAKEGILS